MKTTTAALICLIGLLSPVSKAAALQQASLPLAHIRVDGNSRFTADQVIAASGLKIGQVVGRSDFDAAGKRLLDTGMFVSASYHYEPAKEPAKGYDVALQIVEISEVQPIRLDIPGVDGEALLKWIQLRDPLLLKATPSGDKAIQRYISAIEQYLKEQNRPEPVVAKTEADVRAKTKEISVVIRPKVLPIVREIKFEGIKAASNDALLKPMARPGLGSEYTEDDFRRLLDLNVRPVYDQLGCLTATFPKVEAAPRAEGDGVAVTVTVDEGVVYHLSKVNLHSGDFEPSDLMKAAEFPTGKVANWKAISDSVANMERLFTSSGYIHVASRLERHLDAASGSLTLDVTVDSGKQYYFGKLVLQNLEASADAKTRSLWKLEQGQPMDMQYLEDYKKKIFDERAVGSRNTVQQEMKERPGTDLVDVFLAFR